MFSRSFSRRLLTAFFAVVQLVAPAAAALVDARPAALAISERPIEHAEEPGFAHPFAHQEHCVLCSAATHLDGTPTTPAPLVTQDAGPAPAFAAYVAQSGVAERLHSRSRAPPV